MEENNNKNKFTLKKFPKKNKIIIIGILLITLSIILYCVILIVPLMKLGIIDITAYGAEYKFGITGDSSSYYWPIGSIETTTEGGKLFAKGEPEKTIITSYFGYRDDPFGGGKRYHNGTDIANYRGSGVTNIIAIKDGVVITAQNTPGCNSNEIDETGVCGTGYGNYIEIEHSDGTVSLYGHLHQNSITVKAGETVRQGQVIAKMGSSGRSTGSHLHLEIFINGEGQDALDYVSMDDPRPAVRAGSGFSLTATSLSSTEFENKMNDYCKRSGSDAFCTNFAKNSKSIYTTSKKYNVNPELVVVTAGTEQGWMNPSNSFNYWGLDVPNGSNDVGSYGSLENGIKAYGTLINDYSDPKSSFYDSIKNRYEQREKAGCDPAGHGMPGTLEGMQSIYSWVGTYRFDPGSSGLGGCYYLNIIYGKGYCDKKVTCKGDSNCPKNSKTTICEQNDYTAWQLKDKIEIRYDIFGL